MKSIYFIVFCLLSRLELAATTNNAGIGVTVTSETVSDVSVHPTSISTIIENIFDLRETSKGNQNVGTVTVTYQTNTPNHKLVLTSSEIFRDFFYLHHDSLYTANNSSERLLLHVTYGENNTSIKNNGTLVSTSSDESVRDESLTINVKLKPTASNTAASGDYSGTLTLTWIANI